MSALLSIFCFNSSMVMRGTISEGEGRDEGSGDGVDGLVKGSVGHAGAHSGSGADVGAGAAHAMRITTKSAATIYNDFPQ